MAKKTSNKDRKPKLDPLSFMQQPHDKYVRFVLQTREVALQLIQFCFKPDILEILDLATLTLSDDSFIDSKLRSHFSDICYTGLTKTDTPFRITLIFEHKSWKPAIPVSEQLLRYITNVWSADIQQKRPLSLTIPVLIYHDLEPISKETPFSLFPGAPQKLLSYIPAFDYELLDISRIPDETLEHLDFLLIRNILLALKHSRDDQYIDKFWEKIIIFAPEVRDEMIRLEIFQATVLYINRVSPIFNQKIQYMDNALSAAEHEVVKPYLIELYEQGIEKGIEQGIEQGFEQGIKKGREKGKEEAMKYLILTFLKKNPTWTDEQVATYFEIDTAIVKKVREAKR